MALKGTRSCVTSVLWPFKYLKADATIIFVSFLRVLLHGQIILSPLWSTSDLPASFLGGFLKANALISLCCSLLCSQIHLPPLVERWFNVAPAPSPDYAELHRFHILLELNTCWPPPRPLGPLLKTVVASLDACVLVDLKSCGKMLIEARATRQLLSWAPPVVRNAPGNVDTWLHFVNTEAPQRIQEFSMGIWMFDVI